MKCKWAGCGAELERRRGRGPQKKYCTEHRNAADRESWRQWWHTEKGKAARRRFKRSVAYHEELGRRRRRHLEKKAASMGVPVEALRRCRWIYRNGLRCKKITTIDATFCMYHGGVELAGEPITSCLDWDRELSGVAESDNAELVVVTRGRTVASSEVEFPRAELRAASDELAYGSLDLERLEASGYFSQLSGRLEKLKGRAAVAAMELEIGEYAAAREIRREKARPPARDWRRPFLPTCSPVRPPPTVDQVRLILKADRERLAKAAARLQRRANELEAERAALAEALDDAAIYDVPILRPLRPEASLYE